MLLRTMAMSLWTLALFALTSSSFTSALSASSANRQAAVKPWGTISIDPQPVVQQHQQQRRQRSVDYISLGTYFGTAVSAGAELLENFESVGHHHGVLFLVGSKVCREMNVLREAFKHSIKEVEHVRWGRRPFDFLLRILTDRAFAMALMVGALAAAFVEVFEDAVPGGEHGAILLASNELLELLEGAKVMPSAGPVAMVLKNCLFRLVLNVGALAFALYETFETITHRKIGAHHGVALLAFMKTLRTIGLLRAQFKEKHEEKQKRKLMEMKAKEA